MKPVSIKTFIHIVYEYDTQPPSEATVRRRCAQTDENGNPSIPGAFRDGKPWRIDLDTYFSEMQKRLEDSVIFAVSKSDREFLEQITEKLS